MRYVGVRPAVVQREGLYRACGGGRLLRMLVRAVRVEVIDAQVVLTCEEARERRLSGLRTAADPEDMRKHRANVGQGCASCACRRRRNSLFLRAASAHNMCVPS